MTKIIPGAKKELARGFADANTPRKHLDEIYMVLSTKREELLKKRQQLEEMGRDPLLTPGQRKHIGLLIRQNNEMLSKLKEKMKKQVDINAFMISHLRAYVAPEQFQMAARLARIDAKEALDHIAWITEGDDDADMAANK